MRKGILEFCVLSVIARGEVYTSDLLDELTEAQIVVKQGTLYPLLSRLRKSGLVDYKWVESLAGPPRKYYTLTAEGADFLEGMRGTWNAIVASTDRLVQGAPHADSEPPAAPVTIEPDNNQQA